jgi:hypothetical protein
MAEAIARGVAAWARVARGLQDDLRAIIAGLTREWSNGVTEGQIHRLKLLKRQSDGRAGVALLRRRILQVASRGYALRALNDRGTAARVVTMPPSQPAWHPMAGWASRASEMAHPPASLIQQRLWVHDRVRQAAAYAVGVVIRVGPVETMAPVVTRGVQRLWPGQASW